MSFFSLDIVEHLQMYGMVITQIANRRFTYCYVKQTILFSIYSIFSFMKRSSNVSIRRKYFFYRNVDWMVDRTPVFYSFTYEL